FTPGKAVKLRAGVRYLTCAEICVPYEAKLAIDLPAGFEADAPEAALIERFAARVPSVGATKALAMMSALVDGPPGSQVLRVDAAAAAAMKSPDLLIEGPPGFGFGLPRIESKDGGAGAVFRISVSPPPKSVAGGGGDLVGKKLILTLTHGGGAVEQRFTPVVGDPALMPPQPAMGASAAGTPSLIWVLVLALLGGLILNLMPCVLPVLSMKLLSVIGHGGGDTRHVRAGFLASSAGILVSFLALASGAVALKQAGLSVGWGIQFQQPVFLIVMILIVILFACNLWGLFEINLPGRIADAAAGAGQGSGLAGHFATGAFATLLATPCTAPFLGTAIGFALSRGAVEIYAVFIALGIGLALPYLAVAAAPRLATWLPKPGHWMITMRRILGFALAATALWLLSVLMTQAGIAIALTALLLTVALVAVLGLVKRPPQLRHGAAWAVVAVLAVLSFMAPTGGDAPAASPAKRDSGAAGIDWRPFDPAAIGRAVALGKTVFVDVTADWCLTCKVNKALVLERGAVLARLSAGDVIAMQADWTRPDPVIAAFLQRYSRYGIPFNAAFGPSAPAGRVLPELLTTDSVLEAIDEASGARLITNR
ncbi:MAG: protein-disulfide reductase DsbD family protein, partial [Alphaproteobacteria bacterium]